MAEQEERMFPTLTQPQVARVTAHGRVYATSTGQVLIEDGAPAPAFFVVLEGHVEIVQHGPHGETLVVTYSPGQFTGEVNMLSARRSLTQARVSQGGKVIELDSEHLLELVQRDAEISEILMRAFILRRVYLIARGLSDVVLLGSRHCGGTLRVREFLSRNGHPYSFVDLDSDSVAGYEAAVLNALEDTENSRVTFGESQRREATLERAATQSTTAARLARQRFEGGLSDFLSVLQAERDALAAQDSLAQGRTQKATSLIAVYKALGGGWMAP